MTKNESPKGTSGRERVLTSAAELLQHAAPKGIELLELSKRADVSRTYLYKLFRTETGMAKPQMAIFSVLTGGFLRKAEEWIKTGLTIAPYNSGPVDRLTIILRTTLLAFREHALWGRVVLRHLDLAHPGFSTARSIFRLVDEIIAEAIQKQEIIVPMRPTDVRHVLFYTTYGLLRLLYLDEQGEPREDLTEAGTQAAVLQVLAGFCSDAVRANIEGQISALRIS